MFNATTTERNGNLVRFPPNTRRDRERVQWQRRITLGAHSNTSVHNGVTSRYQSNQWQSTQQSRRRTVGNIPRNTIEKVIKTCQCTIIIYTPKYYENSSPSPITVYLHLIVYIMKNTISRLPTNINMYTRMYCCPVFHHQHQHEAISTMLY